MIESGCVEPPIGGCAWAVIAPFARSRLTQAQPAERAGITQGVVAQLESGKRRSSAALLGKLAGALNLDVDDLVWDDG